MTVDEQLERAILGRVATPDERSALDRVVKAIAEEEDRLLMEWLKKYSVAKQDKKFRKRNYRAWKAIQLEKL